MRVEGDPGEAVEGSRIQHMLSRRLRQLLACPEGGICMPQSKDVDPCAAGLLTLPLPGPCLAAVAWVLMAG